MKSLAVILSLLFAAPAVGPDPHDVRVALDVEHQINLARTDPAAYARRLRAHRALYDGDVIREPGAIAIRTIEGVAAVDEAIAFLERQEPLPALTANAILRLAAADHVEDQGPFGAVGHAGSDGSAFTDRTVRHGGPAAGGENISYGGDTGEAVVIQLIVDDGVPDRGHRINLFRPGYVSAGAACGPHRAYRYMCVIDFGYAEQPRPRR
jgi:hypothetical protein